jgi:N-acetylhexosamine 1-kinase
MSTPIVFPISQWNLPETAAVAPVGDGLINATYCVTAPGSGERYLLQRINTHVFPDAVALMDNHVALAQHLAQNHTYALRIPTPMPTHEGLFCHCDAAGDFWRMMPFFENTYAPAHLPNEKEAYAAAHAYGQFLRALSDFPHERLYQPLPGFHDTLARYRRLERAVATDPIARCREVRRELDFLSEKKAFFEKIAQMLDNATLPIRTVHNDTKAGNVLLDTTTGQAVAVIDWDTVMPGSVLSDYGDMVRTFVPNAYEDAPADALETRPEIWAALDAGFLETTADWLTHHERAHLRMGGQWIVGEQAIRFLTDYLEGDVYYKIAYPTHNLDRARNQLALLTCVTVD